MSMTPLVFTTYDPKEDLDVKELFQEYPHKDYQLKFIGLAKSAMVKYLESTLSKRNTTAICLRNGAELVGLVGLEAMPWMSERFRMRMFAIPHLLARRGEVVVFKRLLRYVMEELAHVDFLDCRVAVDDIPAANSLEASGFRYIGVETYMLLHLGAQEKPRTRDDFEIGPALEEEHEELSEMCSEIHFHNRFIYDPVITNKDARSLYGGLFSHCFDHSDFSVMVARSKSGPVGYVVSKINPYFSAITNTPSGSVAFAGVSPEARGYGLAETLIRWALYDLAKKRVSIVAARILASNYPALCTALKLGFKVTSNSLHFHRWVQRPTTPIPPTSENY